MVVLIVVWIVLMALGINYSFLVALALTFLVGLATLVVSITTIKRQQNNLSCSSLSKTRTLNQIHNVETWWNYDFGSSSTGLTSEGTLERRQHSNKINVYAEVKGAKETITLYEQIHLSSKFPNNHQFQGNRIPDKQNLFKVWDIDNCIRKLGLGEFV